MSKNVLVKADPTLYQQPGDSPTIRDLGRAFLTGRGTRALKPNEESSPFGLPAGKKIGVGRRLAAGLGLAGKVGAAAATAQQTAERMQGGDFTAPLQAGYTYQANDPTGKLTAGAINAEPTKHNRNRRARGNPNYHDIRLPKPGEAVNDTPLVPAPAPAPQAPAPQAPVAISPSVAAQRNAVQQIPLPTQAPVAISPQASAPYGLSAQEAMMRGAVPPQPQPQPQPPQPQPQPPQPQAQPQQGGASPAGVLLQGHPHYEEQDYSNVVNPHIKAQQDQINSFLALQAGQDPNYKTQAEQLTDAQNLMRAFTDTVFDKLGPNMVYKMTPHQLGTLSAYMYLKLS